VTSLLPPRRGNLPVVANVVPIPIGPVEVLCASRSAEMYWGPCSTPLKYAKTSSTGRWMVMVRSIVIRELPAVRLLAEIGDDATRFADARGLKAYAGAAPVTRASVPHRQAAAASSVPNVLRCHRITRASMSTMSHQLAASRGLPQTAPGLAMKAPVASQW
jgi:Transposase IS116/IS110/IS902 family